MAKTFRITGRVINSTSVDDIKGRKVEAWDKDLLVDDLVGRTVALPIRGKGFQTMNKHNLFYYLYASFMNAQLSLLKMAAFYFDKLHLLDPVSASRATIGTDHDACEADSPDFHLSGFAGDFKL